MMFLRAIQYLFFKNYFTTPPNLIFYVTSKCNLRCKHCYYWQELNKKEPELSLEEIESLCRQLGKLDILWLGGGEPFLREDLADIVRLFYGHNGVRILSIPTNGWDTERVVGVSEEILRISGRRKVNVVVSLDGDKETHDFIRGTGSFERASNTIRTLNHLAQRYPTLLVRINVTVSDQNLEGVYRLLDQASGLFGRVGVFNLSLLRGDPYDKDFKLPSPVGLRRLWQYKREKVDESKPWYSRLIERATFEAGVRSLEKGERVFPCEAGRLMGVVFEDGRVGACEQLPVMGSIKETKNLKLITKNHNKKFKQVWNSPQACQLRADITARRCFCPHDCFLLPSLVANPWELVKLLV